jgi:hypothetical protein
VVIKALAWLSAQPRDPRIEETLVLLGQVEKGAAVPDADWRRVTELLGAPGRRVWRRRQIGA